VGEAGTEPRSCWEWRGIRRQGALLEAGITGGVVALEFLVLRHGPSKRLSRALAVINFGDAGLTGATAGRNWRVAGR